MEMKLLPWIQDDIAIEIIGKMISEQVQLLNEWVAAFVEAGLEPNDKIIIESSEYKNYLSRISKFQSEIKEIYIGRNLEELHTKITKEYAPYLKGKYGYNFSIV